MQKALSGHSNLVNSVAISPDGRLLASGSSDQTVKLWSLPNGALLKTLAGHSSYVQSLVISPDGRLLASGGADNTIRLWSLPDGKELPVCLMDPAASPASVSGATYSKDGGVYTLPCGSPIPAGAVCTCNCVPGTACSCVSYSCSCVSYSGGGGSCSCIPVTYYYPN
jgi:WD40 repeat protein